MDETLIFIICWCSTSLSLCLLLSILEQYTRLPWYVFFFSYQVKFKNGSSSQNFLKKVLMALNIYSIPLILMIESRALAFTICPINGACSGICLRQVSRLAQRLEERLSFEMRIKSNSEVDITKIENGV